MSKITKYFRPAIAEMQGYTPGEQPKLENLIKLNTNENPYPPSPAVEEALRTLDYRILRRYPDPLATKLRQAIAQKFAVPIEMVIAGNGSDDLLTMIFRCFSDSERAVACFKPTYSLYKVLAEMQEAKFIEMPLAENFALPGENILLRMNEANLLVIARPNAPTGNVFGLDWCEKVAQEFDGIVVFDEAYADFADDNCMELAKKYPNVLVIRTFSKSYSLAGARLGFAVGSPELIEGLMKVKDSYNLDAATQIVGLAAFEDEAYLRQTATQVVKGRIFLTDELRKLNFRVIDSKANFVFASPPDRNGEKLFRYLRDHAVVVRYFPGENTGEFVRITVGTESENRRLLELCALNSAR